MSSINAAIPLQGQQPQIESQNDWQKQSLNVQQLINAVQLQKQQQANNALLNQQEQVKTEQMKQQQQDMNTMRELAPQFSKKGADGIGTFDLDGLATAAQARGVNPQTINQLRMQNYQMQEAASKAGSEKLANELGHNKAAYEILEGIKAIQDPQQRQSAYQTGLNRLKLLGMDTSHLPGAVPDDKGLEAQETELGMHGQLISDAKTLAETNEKNAAAAEKEWQKFPELGVMVNTKTGEQRQVAGAQGAMTPAMIESKYLAVDQKKQLGHPVTPEESAFQKSVEKYKTLVPVAQVNLQQSLLTPEAKEALGQQFRETGQLPQGMRSPAMSAQIMNRGVEQQPGVDIAAAKAGYNADSASLKKLQTTFDNVNAFENTAGKNLDVFLDQAKKVTDSGLPVLNTPARYIAKKLGGADQAAFETARTTALTEIAKVLSSAGAGSGVLSDSARHEVEGLISPDATLKQITSAANILKTDMANRHEAYAKQIQDIKGRIGGQGGGQGGATNAKTLTMAIIRQAAKDHNISEAEALKSAKAAGYEVKD